MSKVLHFMDVPPRNILRDANSLLNKNWNGTLNRHVGSCGVHDCSEQELLNHIKAVKSETDNVRGMSSVGQKLLNSVNMLTTLQEQSARSKKKMALAFEVSTDALDDIWTSCEGVRLQISEKTVRFDCGSGETITIQHIIYYLFSALVIYDPAKKCYALYYSFIHADDHSPWHWAIGGQEKYERLQALKADTRDRVGKSLANLSNGHIEVKELSAIEYHNMTT
ncbi:hypothetical protein EDD21DRAFT_383657 [Dissophora ornata]|nr:hypothetical protein BGZ58_009429 [Dissophora ornata]KAI8598057.1 hypothetical protein EDD21DRAFT_383657 [Dissophora ornata]